MLRAFVVSNSTRACQCKFAIRLILRSQQWLHSPSNLCSSAYVDTGTCVRVCHANKSWFNSRQYVRVCGSVTLRNVINVLLGVCVHIFRHTGNLTYKAGPRPPSQSAIANEASYEDPTPWGPLSDKGTQKRYLIVPDAQNVIYIIYLLTCSLQSLRVYLPPN